MPLHIEPLGDQALLITCHDEPAAWQLANQSRTLAPPWLIDVVAAYASVALYFDPLQIDWSSAAAQVRAWPSSSTALPVGRLWTVPCCYELGLDTQAVCAHLKLTPRELAEFHQATLFTVYAIGFSPGFPYLGYLPASLQGMPRMAQPRTRVEPGSIGLAGTQSGIYPLPTPGGWHLIGRTPCRIVDVEADDYPLRVGDQVRFAAIDRDAFAAQLGRRLG